MDLKDIFEPTYEENESPPDNTRITQVILYFDEQDAILVKQLAKEAMKIEMPEDYLEKGNISDLFLIMLKKYYGNQSIEIKGIDVRQGVREKMDGTVSDGKFF